MSDKIATTSLRYSSSTKEELIKFAKEDKRSLNSLIEVILDEYVANRKSNQEK